MHSRHRGAVLAFALSSVVAAACSGAGGMTPAEQSYAISGTVAGGVTDGVLITLSGASSATTTTAGGGAFSFSGLANGSYTITPSMPGYTFSPTSLAVTVNGGNVSGQSFTATALTYSISGTVSGAIADGVLVTLGGASSATATTAGGGAFSFSGLANGSYTLTPSKAGFTFSPAALNVTVANGNATGQNFTASAITYTISGTVSGAIADGVLVTIGGAGGTAVTTANGGKFSFPGVANGDYTITPSKAGYTFSPTSTAVTVNGGNVTGLSFVAVAAAGSTHGISGVVSGAIADGVLVTLSGASSGTAITANGGAFSFSGLADGSYTLTPTKAGYTFSPASLNVAVSGADKTAQNFAATALTYQVSGAVSGDVTDGVTITVVGGPGGTTTTANGGAFSLTLPNGSYTLTPSKAGYTFSPASISVTVNAGNVSGNNFTGTARTYVVSGLVAGVIADGVTVTLTGGPGGSTMTANGGAFSFTLPNGTYTLTPNKAGYTFSPPSRNVTVNGASVSGLSFTSTAVTYTVSGSVSGAISDGVNVTLSGGPGGSAITANGGGFSFPGLADGTYTLTPTKSGYSFSPASIAVTVNGADVPNQNFTANSLGGYTISGTLSGPWVNHVAVHLVGANTPTVETGADGKFSFAGLSNGSYTVTPALQGYSFSPANQTVTVSFADAPGKNFTARPAIASYSISGNVTYPAGTYNGRIYLSAYSTTCSGCSPIAGTSVAGPGSYVIRGLVPDTYTVSARLDVGGHGQLNANDPTGATATPVTITSASAANANIALADAIPPTPTAPGGLRVFAGGNAALIVWNVPGSPETATSYEISWGTDSAATNRGTIAVAARDDGHYIQSGLSNGDVLYYKIRSLVGTARSAFSPVVGPVTIGPVGGGYTVSGTVAFPGTATGPLYVAIGIPGSGIMHVGYVPTPASSPASFSISGVGAGQQYLIAILDQNGDHVIDEGDLANTSGNLDVLNVTGDTSAAVSLQNANAYANITTQHGSTALNQDFYQIDAQVSDGVRKAVTVTLFSGKNVAVPLDIGKDWQFSAWFKFGLTRPAVGDTYRMLVIYSDGSSEVLTANVTAVLDAFAQNLSANTSAPYATQPLLTWAAPASPPASYNYYVSLFGSAWWWYPNNGLLPPTTLQVQYNVDNQAWPTTLTSGTYDWAVTVEDAAGNQAMKQATFTIP
jgi:uncharacterized protein (DUF2141 family)